MVKIEKQIRSGLPLVGYPPYGQIHAHSTGNRNSTAQNEADYMNRKDINSGFYTHIVGNGRVIQVANTNRGAWDVGGGWNQWGYASVELIESHRNKEEFLRDYKIYVDLLRSLADEAGIPKKLDSGNIGINTHEYCTYNQPGNASDHVDPYPYLQKWGITRQQFKKDVENGIKGASAVSKPSYKKNDNYWQEGHYFVAKQDLITKDRKWQKTDKTWMFKKGSRFAVREREFTGNGACHAKVADMNVYVTMDKRYVEPQ